MNHSVLHLQLRFNTLVVNLAEVKNKIVGESERRLEEVRLHLPDTPCRWPGAMVRLVGRCWGWRSACNLAWS